jgi:GntR family transcriptional regulator
MNISCNREPTALLDWETATVPARSGDELGGGDGELLAADTPVQLQIYRRMRAEIVDGLWIDREDFPGERELAERFGVSVITSRGALDRLAREGLVERQRGRGTRATYEVEEVDDSAPPRIFPPAGPSGFTYHVQRVWTDIGPAEACRAFGLPPGSELWQAIRLAKVNGRVHSVFHNMQPPEIGRRHRAADLKSKPMVSIFESEGTPLATIRRTIRATTAPPDAARHLGIELDSAVLLIVMRAQTADERIVEWLRIFTRPDQRLPEEVLDLSTGGWHTPPPA